MKIEQGLISALRKYDLKALLIAINKKSTRIAVYEFGDTIFYLLALSEFDENNNAQNSKKELLKTIKSLLEFYDKHGQGNNLYIPLIGSGLSRTGIDKKEALETLSMMLCLYAKNLQGDVNIIVYKGDRDKVSIDVR